MIETPLIIIGSARKQSETEQFAAEVFKNYDVEIIELLTSCIAPYNYLSTYPSDDAFREICKKMLLHRTIIFATPVYWYAMSGVMKTFFDRFTDIVTVQKEVGRQLRGKSIFLLAVGADPQLPPGFEVPFKLTAQYLDMVYGGCIYHSTKSPSTREQTNIDVFLSEIKTTLAI